MKKVFLFLSSALICAFMAACGGNAENADTLNNDTTPAEDTEITTPAENNAEPAADVNSDARAQAIHDAAQAICNCGDLTNCVNTVIDQSFAQYKNDAEFKAAVKKEAETCIANKVKDKALEKGREGAKELGNAAANAAANKLGLK